MQPGDTPLLQISVKHEEINKRSVWVTVIHIGRYTTIELLPEQMLMLTRGLTKVQDAWFAHQVRSGPVRTALPSVTER